MKISDPPKHPPIINVKTLKPTLPEKPAKQQSPEQPCLCYAIAPALWTCNLFGLLPVTWDHEKGKCFFKKSYVATFYSLMVCVAYIFHLLYFSDLLHFERKKPLPELLALINDLVYWIFIIILTMLSIMSFPRFVVAFNKLQKVILDADLVCSSSFEMLRKINYGYVSTVMILLLFQYSVLTWLHASESYHTNFDHRIIFNLAVRNVPFIFYLIFMSFCSTFISILACFERLVISALHFRPVHPLSEIDETDNKHKFLGLIECELCKGDHKCSAKLLQLSAPELVEHLRSLHEDISLLIYECNACLNPQLLFFTVVELTVLIIHWYEVVVYTSYTFSTPYASTINILSWMFVLSHSIGLFLFLKSAQDLKNMIHGLTNILLEYSTRISTTEEHQQVRLFIEKLKLHRSLTASGVFNIDLGIAAPISANILTYVLVALQFDIPKN